ncbi:hypothetical protein [Roseovarius sp.]|uniref:hypothetical protein n=1 Tax=Roseovarius sp. TaxID=1486281 RepID=UPI003BAD2957
MQAKLVLAIDNRLVLLSGGQVALALWKIGVGHLSRCGCCKTQKAKFGKVAHLDFHSWRTGFSRIAGIQRTMDDT